MANLQQVVQVLETLYPLRYAEEWDHPGLIVGDLEDDVHSIVFAADPTTAVIDEAVASGADLIVTHHPLFFRATHSVSTQSFRGHIVSTLYRAHCALWVGHTNADAAYRGVAQAAADAFGILDQQPLVPIEDPTSPVVVGEGRVGHLAAPVSLRTFAQTVAAALPHTAYGIQISGPLDMPVRRVAVLPGSGDSMFSDVNRLGVDVYVTSDLRHHPATDEEQQAQYEALMRERGIALGTPGSEPTNVSPCLINTPHSAIESMWFRYAMHDVPQAVQQATGDQITVRWNNTSTDPWNWIIPGTVQA